PPQARRLYGRTAGRAGGKFFRASTGLIEDIRTGSRSAAPLIASRRNRPRKSRARRNFGRRVGRYGKRFPIGRRTVVGRGLGTARRPVGFGHVGRYRRPRRFGGRVVRRGLRVVRVRRKIDRHMESPRRCAPPSSIPVRNGCPTRRGRAASP